MPERTLKHPDQNTDQKRGYNSSLTNSVDFPKTAERKNDGKRNDGSVKAYFDGSKGETVFFRDRSDKTVARHVGYIGQELKSDARRQQNATENFLQQAEQVTCRNIKR